MNTAGGPSAVTVTVAVTYDADRLLTVTDTGAGTGAAPVSAPVSAAGIIRVARSFGEGGGRHDRAGEETGGFMGGSW